ncbi:cation diffusion facilitator family transporter [Acidianus sulfidivorans JP7]|uniref:Cation transporter n=1 Tax=Acidianus sulfidivorans JP7 TaxID=619593 RepID=A0A2U9IKT2_9CREN|nr:cation diffusion facilitator family transporter [Acidianus sulfidivorans]AWR96524.1 cation diffusion facilitator family transporter [Acidianus sulfidivorans JP7]
MKSIVSFWSMFLILTVFAIYSKSSLLASEAFHAFFDALVVTLSFYVIKKLNNINSLYTYGMHRMEILFSLLNVLVVIIGAIIGAIIAVLFILFGIKDNPSIIIIASTIVSVLSIIASTEESRDEITKSVKIHAILDSSIYIIGIVIGVLIFITKYYVLDPISSLLILGIIIIKIYPQVKSNIDVLMEKSPIDVGDIQSYLAPMFPGVHHVHVWSICPHIKVATLHITEDPKVTLLEMDKKREYIQKLLSERFGINHVTVQFETKKTD